MIESVIVNGINELFEPGWYTRTPNSNCIHPTKVISYDDAMEVGQYLEQILGDLGQSTKSVQFVPYSELDGTKSLKHYSEPGWCLVLDTPENLSTDDMNEINMRIKEEFHKYDFDIVDYYDGITGGFFMIHKKERTMFLNEN